MYSTQLQNIKKQNYCTELAKSGDRLGARRLLTTTLQTSSCVQQCKSINVCQNVLNMCDHIEQQVVADNSITII